MFKKNKKGSVAIGIFIILMVFIIYSVYFIVNLNYFNHYDDIFKNNQENFDKLSKIEEGCYFIKNTGLSIETFQSYDNTHFLLKDIKTPIKGVELTSEKKFYSFSDDIEISQYLDDEKIYLEMVYKDYTVSSNNYLSSSIKVCFDETSKMIEVS